MRTVSVKSMHIKGAWPSYPTICSFSQNYCIHMDIGISKHYLGVWAIINNPQGKCTCYSLTYRAVSWHRKYNHCCSQVNDAEDYNMLKIRLETDIQNLEQHLEVMRATYQLNTEKLEYNYRVLVERDHENTDTINQQKRKISRQRDILSNLKARCLLWISAVWHTGKIAYDDVSFFNSTASTWTLATPRATWESYQNPIRILSESDQI